MEVEFRNGTVVNYGEKKQTEEFQDTFSIYGISIHVSIRIDSTSVLVRLFICTLWSPAGKGLTSWLSFVVSTVSLSLSHWYPGSGVVLDCIDS